MKNRIRVLSLFSGCGGLDLGLEGGFTYLGKKYGKLPIEVVWANDINEKACETLKRNMPNVKVVCGDITKVLKDPKTDLPEVDVVVGGFPCQDFSLAGKRKGLTVKRGQLYLSMIEVIRRTKPAVFMAENVKGLISWENGLGIKTMVDDFAKDGYTVEYQLLNTADYGVPQTRQRVIILGVRKNTGITIKWPARTHGEGQKPWVTLSDAIGDILSDEDQSKLPNFGYSKAKMFPGTQGNTITSADKPGPTMRAEHHGNIEFHYSLKRRLSAREAARIQSFPDNFEFYKSISDAYKQIGNAVAPVFGWHLGKNILDMLDSREKND